MPPDSPLHIWESHPASLCPAEYAIGVSASEIFDKGTRQDLPLRCFGNLTWIKGEQ
jgi:hypothetical protein